MTTSPAPASATVAAGRARRAVRHGRRLAADVVAYGRWTGHWWLPIVLIVIVVVSLVATATAKVVVPVTLYTLL